MRQIWDQVWQLQRPTAWSGPPGKMVRRRTSSDVPSYTACTRRAVWLAATAVAYSREVTWSRRDEPATRRTAALRTDCSRWISQAGRPIVITVVPLVAEILIIMIPLLIFTIPINSVLHHLHTVWTSISTTREESYKWAHLVQPAVCRYNLVLLVLQQTKCRYVERWNTNRPTGQLCTRSAGQSDTSRDRRLGAFHSVRRRRSLRLSSARHAYQDIKVND